MALTSFNEELLLAALPTIEKTRYAERTYQDLHCTEKRLADRYAVASTVIILFDHRKSRAFRTAVGRALTLFGSTKSSRLIKR